MSAIVNTELPNTLLQLYSMTPTTIPVTRWITSAIAFRRKGSGGSLPTNNRNIVRFYTCKVSGCVLLHNKLQRIKFVTTLHY